MFPKTVQIGPVTYDICTNKQVLNEQCRKFESDLFGCSVHSEQLIVIDPELAIDIACDTLAHEIEHCIFSITATELSHDEEEQLIRATSSIRLDTYRRNLEVTKFLLTGSKTGKF